SPAARRPCWHATRRAGRSARNHGSRETKGLRADRPALRVAWLRRGRALTTTPTVRARDDAPQAEYRPRRGAYGRPGSGGPLTASAESQPSSTTPGGYDAVDDPPATAQADREVRRRCNPKRRAG